MSVTPNMGLTAWDLPSDNFDHSQLAGNWFDIDAHDHTEGKGARIKTNSLEAKCITHNLLALEAVHSENIQKGAVGTEQIDPHFLPLGSITMWYRQSGDTKLPEGGWEICDGRSWASIPNNLGYTTGSIPNLVGSFPRGADLLGKTVPIGASGGTSNASLAHAHAVTAHSHSVGPHTHPVSAHSHSISVDGNHNHGFNAVDSESTGQPMRQHLAQEHTGSGPGARALELNNIGNETTAFMQTTGKHAHGNSTGSGGAGSTGGNSGFASGETAPSTDTQLGTISTIPPFVGLLFIMKVR